MKSDQRSQERGAVKQRSRFDDTGALCVQSVPNRSVEDLDHDDCVNCNFSGLLSNEKNCFVLCECFEKICYYTYCSCIDQILLFHVSKK